MCHLNFINEKCYEWIMDTNNKDSFINIYVVSNYGNVLILNLKFESFNDSYNTYLKNVKFIKNNIWMPKDDIEYIKINKPENIEEIMNKIVNKYYLINNKKESII